VTDTEATQKVNDANNLIILFTRYHPECNVMSNRNQYVLYTVTQTHVGRQDIYIEVSDRMRGLAGAGAPAPLFHFWLLT